MTKHIYNSDLAHLKWKLINNDGLSPKEAEDRIKEIKKWSKKR